MRSDQQLLAIRSRLLRVGGVCPRKLMVGVAVFIPSYELVWKLCMIGCCWVFFMPNRLRWCLVKIVTDAVSIDISILLRRRSDILLLLLGWVFHIIASWSPIRLCLILLSWLTTWGWLRFGCLMFCLCICLLTVAKWRLQPLVELGCFGSHGWV